MHPTTEQFSHFMSTQSKRRFYRGFEDSPWNHGNCYKVAQANFPDALFILNVREPARWITSFTKWISVTRQNLFLHPSYQCVLRTNCGAFKMNPFELDQEDWVQRRLERDQAIVDFFTGHAPKKPLGNVSFQRPCGDFEAPPFLKPSSSTLLLLRTLDWRPFEALGFSLPNASFPYSNKQKKKKSRQAS